MFRKRGENLHTIYVFLFLNVAFFFLEHQDAAKFANLFKFDLDSFLSGQYWRIVTYQFTVAGQGWWFFPKPLVLFFTLLILYLMGAAVEEEWGTFNFLAFFVVSTIATAALASWLGVPLLGSYFVNYSLLFVYASLFPEQTFYLFAVLPIRVRWLAYLAFGLLLWGAFVGGTVNIAVLGGSLAGYVYYLLQRTPQRVPRKDKAVADTAKEVAPDMTGVRNAARFVAIRKALAAGADPDLDRLIAQADNETVRGVNICPPADYKPESTDGYCIKCEGFAECSARYMRLQRSARTVVSAATSTPAPEPVP